MLKTTHRSVCHGSENPIDLRPFARIARQVAELEFLLHPFNGVASASLFDLDDQRRPNADGLERALASGQQTTWG